MTKYIAQASLPEDGFVFFGGFVGVRPHLNEKLLAHISIPEFALLTVVNLVLLTAFYALIVSWRSRRMDRTLALLFIIGGGVSNIFDRIVYGAVIDFIVLGYTPVFNIADVMIVIGVILLARSLQKEEKRV
ncbi:MAG: signal peptidase II [Candidatus Kerfeldbacteria bacterium]|nr:signal peptidase II [Candidatus Kerfeldbacteria bacterium]